ncbi:unnamed protein product [Arabidopsis arenosa]|uniref:Uncharacterized protein n=1 Tax=Arabidopsis arenosa TaxID=38785 RepID=A0A8S2A1D3_ARAAE|nr:unnamed protein product [Arabidopsis arenosa]
MSSMTEKEKDRDLPQQEIEETTPLLDDSQPEGELRSKTAAAKDMNWSQFYHVLVKPLRPIQLLRFIIILQNLP